MVFFQTAGWLPGTLNFGVAICVLYHSQTLIYYVYSTEESSKAYSQGLLSIEELSASHKKSLRLLSF